MTLCKEMHLGAQSMGGWGEGGEWEAEVCEFVISPQSASAITSPTPSGLDKWIQRTFY